MVARLEAAFAEDQPSLLDEAEAALRALPTDPEVLLLAALAALVVRRPERAQAFLKRFAKRFVAGKPVTLLGALALAQQGQIARAWHLLESEGLTDDAAAARWFIGAPVMLGWLAGALRDIRSRRPRAQGAPRAASFARPRPPPKAPPPARVSKPLPAPPPAPERADLPRLVVPLDIAFEMADLPSLAIPPATGDEARAWFRLRAELNRLSLFEGFDELLSLPALRDVEAHWYQIETVRKVLKQYRGRVLLADEVGLGKTIEAGMIVKEYALRGMAERLLILTPAALVGQWRDEMAAKFGLDCATSHDPLLRADPARFWGQPRVIASIATARRKEHAAILAALSYDVVVVDEAHHLRDQASASYRLVDALRKRFLLLLSATPVQNSLLELYNLLTLLKPGIFKTAKEFRALYMVPGKPREPTNRARLRDLMRGVMVRNTRALVALRLPRRHATTLRVTPGTAEAESYHALTALAREATAAGQPRLAAQHLLAAAGSSPSAAAAALARFAARHAGDHRWRALGERFSAIGDGAKEAALFRLLGQNPAEKKMVFVHHRDTLGHLAKRLADAGLRFARFDGSLSGPEKDRAVAAFREAAPLLLCSESGGEGRNLQFCNTLINFDIPWNPMAIEQRIGRIDRIGQTREVFIFNLATADTIEDAVLRILDEKINMFELVVGEVGAILGEREEQEEFSAQILAAWLRANEGERAAAFAAIEDQLLAARRSYDKVKALDAALFGDDLDAA